MNGWTTIPLGAICETTSGGTPSRAIPQYYHGDIPWIKSGELDNAVIFGSEEHISNDAILASSAKVLPVGTLLLAMYGATVGKMSILGIRAATNQAICGILQSPFLENKFLYYFLQYSRNELLDMRAGAAQPNISQNKVRNLIIPIISRLHQKLIIQKIEELFSEIDKGIESIISANRQLHTYRHAVLQYALSGQLTNIINSTDAKKTNIYEKVEKLCNVSGGITKNAKNAGKGIPHPYLRVANVYSNQFKLDDIATICISSSEREKALLQKGDLLFVEGNGSIDQIGRVAMWEGQISDCVHQNHLIKVRPKVNVVGKYIMYYFLSYEGRNQIKAQASSTAGLFTLSISKIKQLKVPYRDETEQLLIVKEIETRLSLCDKMEQTIEESLKKAEVLRQSILKKAFEGRLVPQDPNDEPVAKLLERIRLDKEAQKPVKKAIGKGRGRKHE